ncbi:uncharacterized protein LOC117602446 [Osmia lignaria lignaria]|uniref:uncharacterized protein LOC117602446 n=1 Tax=Osmia lignaria lignaria TaxID=1437193 RepID=UPI00402B67D8
MLMISQRRRHPRWRMLLTVVILSDLVRHCEPISTKRLTDTSGSSSSSSSSLSSPTLSRSSSSETRSQNLGSPSDLAWQAWLLLDSQNGGQSSLDSATFLRRITPKSVFIAPELPALPPCPDGYHADTMGRCVKSVNIDHQAHLGFLLQRLNTRYGNRGGSSEFPSPNNNPKKSSGPLQLNIPLFSLVDTEPAQSDPEETRGSFRFPIIVPPEEEIDSNEEEERSTEIGTTYETTTQTTTTTPGTSTTSDPTTTSDATTSDTTVSDTTSDATSSQSTTYGDDTSTYDTTIYESSTYETTAYDTTSYENSTEMEKDETSPDSLNTTTIQNDV